MKKLQYSTLFILAIVITCILPNNLFAQTIIFTESFDEAAGSMMGTSTEGVNWSATCPDCAAGDTYEVSPSGAFRGNDTNGPATWCTDPISIPAGTQYIVLEMDFDATEGGGYAGSGNLETADECNSGIGCAGTVASATTGGCDNCWDFVYFEVDEGGGNITNEVLLGQSGTADEGSICQAIDVTGSTEFKLSLVLSMWASAEFLSFDNITVTAYDSGEATAANITAEGACPVCLLELGTPTVSCNDSAFEGANTDAVEISIPFSGAGSSTEVLTLMAGGAAATNTGDDPATMASGTITFAATEGDSYSISLDNNICSAPEVVNGTVEMDLCPAACMMSIQQVTAVCSNDGTTNYDLCIDFTHSNPDANALVDIEVNDGSVITSSSNVVTTGNIQQQKYTGIADGDTTADVDITIRESGGGGSGNFVIDFDGNDTGYTLSSPQSGNGVDYWGVFDDSGITVSFTGSSGNYFASQDDSAAPDPSTITIANIDISCLSSPISFSVDLAEDDADDNGEDWDLADFVHFDYSIDGGTTQNLLWIESVPDGDAFNTVPAIDTDFDGDGDGTNITDTWTTFTSNITGTGNLLTLTITVDLDSGDEDIAFDNIQIQSCTSGASCSTSTTYTEPDCSCPENPTVNPDGPYTICDGTTIVFTDAAIGGAATTGTWAIVSGPSTNATQLSDTNPVADPSTVSFTPDGGAGTYVLSLTSDAPLSCVAATQNVNVVVETQETATLTYMDDMECMDGSDLSPTITGTMGGTYAGSLGLVIDAITGFVDVSATQPGTYMVTYTSSTNTCRATATDEVTIHPVPEIAAITAPTIACPTQMFDLTTLTVTDNNNVASTTTTYHTVMPTSATDTANELTGAALTLTADASIFVMVANTATGCFDVASVTIDIPDCAASCNPTILTFPANNE